MKTPPISNCLWFDGKAAEAARFYQSVFPGTREGSTFRLDGYNGGAEGDVATASFFVNDTEFVCLNGGPYFTFNEAVSFFITCDTQEEVDYYWERLTADGGRENRCGWVKDKYGLSWQVVPRMLMEHSLGSDKAKARRVHNAMLQMVKLDIAALQAAADNA